MSRILIIGGVLTRDAAGRRRVEGLARAWVDAGHDVHIFTPGPALRPDLSGCTYHEGSPWWAPLTRRLGWLDRKARRIIHGVDARLPLVNTLLGEIPAARRQVRALVAGSRAQGMGFDVVFSSFSPLTSHVLAAEVAAVGVPWIADYRDLWTDEERYPRGRAPLYLFQGRQQPRGLWALHRRLERHLLTRAARITTVSEPLAAVLRRKTAGRVPVLVVPNGYDDAQVRRADLRDTAFTIAYTGKLNNSTGEPELRLFLTALRRLLEATPSLRECVRIVAVGEDAATWRRVGSDAGMEALMEVRGPSRFDGAIETQRTASALLLMLPLDQERSRGVSSRKLFDYLAARRPILAIVPRSSHAAEIIEETGAGAVCVTGDAVFGWLRDQLAAWADTGAAAYAPNLAALDRYSFTRLADHVIGGVVS